MKTELIRNFCILAHVDHGKSTLADRFLEVTGTVSSGKLTPQYLDRNPISKERGITIKLAPVRMIYKTKIRSPDLEITDSEYILNLIDTPGHVDFSYEVSRSLAACEGGILLVDATQGIQAQTLSYWEKAKQAGLKLIPVVNKIDLPSGQPEEVALSMCENLGFSPNEIIFISAKTGEGVEDLFRAVLARIPPPQNVSGPLQALVFDSWYDSYLGVIVSVRVRAGRIKTGENLRLMASGTGFSPSKIGYFLPGLVANRHLDTGEVGWLATGLKDISRAWPGETVTSSASPALVALEGYLPPQPMVFAGLYPTQQDDYALLAQSLAKLKLSDAALSYTAEHSEGLGKGFRVGFLGPLHNEIVVERLEREFNLSLVGTAPTVVYKIKLANKSVLTVNSVSAIPADYISILEPYVNGTILVPENYLSAIVKLCQDKRGVLTKTENLGNKIKLTYDLPLSEIIVDFFAALKSISSGFASFDYQISSWREGDLAKIDVLVGGIKIDALSKVVAQKRKMIEARELVDRLYKQIPKQMFEFAIQATAGGKPIASQTKKAWRKDVTAKLYGGDQTRKDKLLEKQKKGKKRMKAIGKINIPQEAFMAVLKR